VTAVVHVFDMVTRKPIAGAKVTVDTAEAYTDEAGTAKLTVPPIVILPAPTAFPATVYVKASKPGYVEASKRVALTEDTVTVDLGLIPIWVFPVGILAVGGLILVGAKLAWRM
jgi:hypothetical protein